MDQKTKYIASLAEKNFNSYQDHLKASSVLSEFASERMEEVQPLEGEVWCVIPAQPVTKATMTPATKLMVGWRLDPTYAESGDGKNIILDACQAYPVRRIAESPNANQNATN